MEFDRQLLTKRFFVVLKKFHSFIPSPIKFLKIKNGEDPARTGSIITAVNLMQ